MYFKKYSPHKNSNNTCYPIEIYSPAVGFLYGAPFMRK
jgi:hypothetical protein